MQNGLKKLFEKIKEMNVLKYDLLNKSFSQFFVSFVEKRIFPPAIMRIFISSNNKHILILQLLIRYFNYHCN